MNGSGMNRYLKELRPTTIHDINAMVALYRPGPMETIPQYIERKRNANLVTYLDVRMKDYLDASYGLLVYQDDVLLKGVRRVAVEAAHPQSWYRWVGTEGKVVGIETFGASAPYQRIYEEYGIAAARVVAAIR